MGLALGGGLGLVNAVASFLLYRHARARPDPEFFKFVLGGMGIRMAVVLVVAALAIWRAPIDAFAFLAALLGIFVVGLAVDIAYMLRRPAEPQS